MSVRHNVTHSSQVWLVVADRSVARVFSMIASEPVTLKEIQTLIHSEGACRPQEVATDRPGRFVGWSGDRSAGYPEIDIRHITAKEFAGAVADELERGRQENAFGKLIVIAPPLFLGALRNEFPDLLKRMIVAEIDRELVHASPAELSEYVQRALASTHVE